MNGNDWNEIVKTILATPIGQLIGVAFLLLILSIPFLIWRSIEAASQARKLEEKLEERRLDRDTKDDENRAKSEAENRALLRELVTYNAQIRTVIERMDKRDRDNTDLLHRALDNTDAIHIKQGNIHTDMRKGLVILSNKLDHANQESRTRAESTQIVVNNRAQETQKTVHSVANDIQASLGGQNAVLDQVMHKLIDVGREVAELRTEIRVNTSAHTATALQKATEVQRLSAIERSLEDIVAGIKRIKKDTSDLSQAPVPDPLTPTISAAPTNHATAKLPLPPPTIIPVQEPRLVPPEVHDTKPLPTNTKDKPNA